MEEETPVHKKTPPSPFQKRVLWRAITALSFVVIGAVAVGLVSLGGRVLGYLQPVLVPLAVAGILAYLLQPVIDLLCRRLGWPSGRSMLVVYTGFLALVALLTIVVLVPTFGQAQEFIENRQAYQERVTGLVKKGMESLEERFGGGITADYYERAVDWVSLEGPEIGTGVGKWIWSRLRGAFGFFGYLLGFLLVPIYLYYFLREGRRISRTWADFLPLRTSEFKDEVVGTLTEINGYLISFFRGQMVVSLIDGALVAFALSIMGLPYALLIGVFLAILGLIPYIGNLLVMVPAILIAVAHFGTSEWAEVKGEDEAVRGEVALVELNSGKTKELTVIDIRADGTEAEVLVNAWNWLPAVWAYPLIVLAIFVTLQQINGLVTAPRIVGDSVGLHPLTVIFSVLFWSLLLGGLLGAILAVPLTAAVKVVFRRYVWEKRIEPAVGERFSRGADEEEGGTESGEPA